MSLELLLSYKSCHEAYMRFAGGSLFYVVEKSGRSPSLCQGKLPLWWDAGSLQLGFVIDVCVKHDGGTQKALGKLKWDEAVRTTIRPVTALNGDQADTDKSCTRVSPECRKQKEKKTMVVRCEGAHGSVQDADFTATRLGMGLLTCFRLDCIHSGMEPRYGKLDKEWRPKVTEDPFPSPSRAPEVEAEAKLALQAGFCLKSIDSRLKHRPPVWNCQDKTLSPQDPEEAEQECKWVLLLESEATPDDVVYLKCKSDVTQRQTLRSQTCRKVTSVLNQSLKHRPLFKESYENATSFEKMINTAEEVKAKN
ncbi:hypothetical protein BTVI_156261 [Pitangus sulphuratus]|nr:hypothetical protein BTVI_156261 [Pitangus sulphuratus]